MTPEQLFADLLADRPAQPFVTYYDEATGERSELSAKSLANWVAKTHHLLVDELGLQVGDRAALAVPAHWISIPILLGCLTAGVALTEALPGEIDPTADVAFVDIDRAATAVSAGIPDVFTIDAAAAAAGLATDPPAGTADFVSAVRPQADTWGSVHMPAGEQDACIGPLTRAEVAAAAIRRANELGLRSFSRVITTRDWQGPHDWIDTVLAPLAVRGSVVFVRNASDEVLSRRTSQERADVRI